MPEMILSSLTIYFALGVIFAVLFQAFGLRRIDPSTSDATIGFRVLSFPGCAMLWPVLLMKWVKS
ncbi:MAG: hypothetical protein CMJ35_14025 [Phycisphaerae bacterium]|nr:hypothetical protein [Phycisphaerae bacterium]MBM91426.1 hypothetical protein [Phycisphaerae bacterium]MBM92706.1 hypothetical protein [Phycisphaerae bacterium]HCT44628.1 hypothetical protein [Phycisphaerales bacterium]|tara:strand:- start:1234 stop:1428 length:195 start_codon:yes stop_codon:yes gene_type:complete